MSYLGIPLEGSKPLVHIIIFLAQSSGQLKSCFTTTYYVQGLLPLTKWQIRTFPPFIFFNDKNKQECSNNAWQ